MLSCSKLSLQTRVNAEMVRKGVIKSENVSASMRPYHIIPYRTCFHSMLSYHQRNTTHQLILSSRLILFLVYLAEDRLKMSQRMSEHSMNVIHLIASDQVVPAVRQARERGFGDFEGKTFAEIEVLLPDQSLRWRKRDPEFSPAGGESLVALRARVMEAAQRLAALHPGEQIALVGHGGVMDVLYRAATRLDIQAPRTWALGNAAINRLLWTPEGFTLVGWADTQHLDDDVLDEAAG